MIGINLTAEDIEKIVQDTGTNREINSVDELLAYMEEGITDRTLNGSDFNVIAGTVVEIAEERGVSLTVKELYNVKEKRNACINCLERLKKLFTGEYNEVVEDSSSKGEEQEQEQETQSQSTETTTEHEIPHEQQQQQNSTANFTLPSLEEINVIYSSMVYSSMTVCGADLGLDIYDNMSYIPKHSIRFEDNFTVLGLDTTKYTTAIVAIANSSSTIVAVGTLVANKDGYHIVCDVGNISDSWGTQKLFNIVLFPKSFEDVLNHTTSVPTEPVTLLECYIDKKELEVSDSPLCIDFGTSNTTVGTYVQNQNESGYSIKLAKFLDVTKPEKDYSNMLPTVVYVKDCSNPNDIKYLFGYEAKKTIQDFDYNPKADIFYEIKRWIASEESIEEVMDEHGNTAEVPRIDIINAYLKHVVALAERDLKSKFVELHFTAPVKLKSKFYQIVKHCFEDTEYTIVDENQTIDEGIATIYESISVSLDGMTNSINSQGEKFPKTIPSSVMVLDCGGGTTDVASCNFEIVRDDSMDFYHLNIQTQFINGNSNFGGNNITYRIMQLLKIKLAHSYRQLLNIPCDKIYTRINELIPDSANDILDRIDNGDTNADIYRVLDGEYAKSESIIPTLFGNVTLRNRKSMCKRNFFYLWQLAEKIKVEFYKKNDLLSIGFTDHDDQFRENILKHDDTNFYLYIDDGTSANLVQHNDIPQIEINTKEIDTLIYADIYDLIHRIFASSEDVDTYDFYKLSGQSCKIALFNTLLKELVPGKKLRTRKNNDHTGVSSKELKINCINGSIKYMHDIKTGSIQPHIDYRNSRLIYKIQRNNGGNFEDIMTDSAVKVCTLPENAEFTQIRIVETYSNKVESIKKIELGKSSKSVVYTTHKLSAFLKSKTYVDNSVVDDVIQQLQNVPVDGSNHNNKLYFILPSKDCFSFYNYVIQKSIDSDNNEKYTIIRYKICPFEANVSTTTFFSGKR